MKRSCVPLFLALVATPLTAQRTIRTVLGDARNENLGMAVDTVGDLDRDGYDDVVVGVPGASRYGFGAGLARVLSGRDGSVLFEFPGSLTELATGRSVAGAGDVDGDGYPDVVVGAPKYGLSSDFRDMGLARVYSGRDGSTIHTFSNFTPFAPQYGHVVAGAGDVDADGYDDVLVAGPQDVTNNVRTGAVKLYSGRTGLVLRYFRGDARGDELGHAVAGVGDVDGDGHDDVLIGAWLSDLAGTNSGVARVYSGRDGSVIHEFRGQAGSFLGAAVAGVGDLDGDGRPDFMIGAPGHDGAASNTGRVLVASGADGSTIYAFEGAAANEQVSSCAGVGDVDADGVPDFAYTAYGANDFHGRVSVVSGATGTLLFTADGESRLGGFGTGLGLGLAGAGDVDGDGYGDVIVGEWGHDGNESNAGMARIFALDTSGSTRRPGRLSSYGHGCPGSDGRLPRIGLQGRPDHGRTITVGLSTAPRDAFAALHVGLQRLDLPLDGYGAPGCRWLVDVLVTFSAQTDALGRVALPLAIPDDLTLIGLVFEFQWLAQDAGANAAGFVFSNGGTIELGQR